MRQLFLTRRRRAGLLLLALSVVAVVLGPALWGLEGFIAATLGILVAGVAFLILLQPATGPFAPGAGALDGWGEPDPDPVVRERVVHDGSGTRALTRVERDLHAALFHHYQQVEALLGLYQNLSPTRALPPLRGWAASPDLLLVLNELVSQKGRTRVLECGSGASTLVLAYSLRARGVGRVVSLEHDAEYQAQTTELLRSHGLEDWAEVRHAPLVPTEIDGEEWLWYDLSVLPEGPFDLLFVDGPPGTTQTRARFPALPVLEDRLTDDVTIVLDDAARRDERGVVQQWNREFSGFRRTMLPHEKGTCILERVSRGAAPSAGPRKSD